MTRTILMVLASVVSVAYLTYVFGPAPQRRDVAQPLAVIDNGSPSASLGGPPPELSAVPALLSLLREPFGVRQRAAIYQIAAEAELDVLTVMAKNVWAAGTSASAQFALDVLLRRITEIDGNAGIALIREANLDTETMLAAALTVISTRGVSAADIDSIVLALPQLDERRFKAEALNGLTAIAADKAFALALREPDGSLRIALLRVVAATWSSRDSKAARAALATIEGGVERAAFEAGLITGLANSEPETLIVDAAGSSTVPEPQLELSIAVRRVARTDPKRAIELADQLRGPQREIALRAAIQAWGSEDPYGALGFVERLGPGRDRDTLLQAIGTELGRQDPDSALTWFRSLDSSPQGLYGFILQGVAQRDPQRAMELALDSGDPSAVFLTSRGVRSADVSFPALGERLLRMDDGTPRDERVRTMMNAWAHNNPEEALGWLVTHSEDIGRSTLAQAGATLARQDPDAAIRATELLPAEHRDAWVTAVASGYSQTDPAAAKTWLDQFRGEAVFDAAMMAVVQNSAMRDPAEAADLLPNFTLTATREQAAMTVARQWAGRDPDGAHDWATGLPTGPLRDAALTGVVMMSDDVPDAATLARFQSEQARQKAILNVVSRRAQEDVDDAREMVERHINDPALRAQAEQLLPKD